MTVDGTKVRACVNKKTFSRANEIREHLKLARQHVEVLQREELVEVERLQAEKKWERDKPCQASTTDADAQFMRTSDHGLAPADNVQLATDTAHKLIVDVAASRQPSDSAHRLPALDRVQQIAGRCRRQAVADGDYTSREAVVGAARRGVERYHAKMATGAGKAIYKERAPVAEFPHAWLRCRGIVKAQVEALWACMTYNLQRYFKLSRVQPA